MAQRHYHRVTERQIGSTPLLFERDLSRFTNLGKNKTLLSEAHDSGFVGSFPSKRALQEAISAASTPKPGDTNRSILLYGPEDNNSAHFVRSLTRKDYHEFYNVKGYKLRRRYLELGNGEKSNDLVKALFRLAKKHQPSIIFVENVLEVICPCPGYNMYLAEQFLKCFKELIDSDAKILFIGHTTRPHHLRNWRKIHYFSKWIFDDLPDDAQREEILKAIFTYRPGDCEAPFRYFASRLSECTRSQIEMITNKVCKAHYNKAEEIRKRTGVTAERLILTFEFIDRFVEDAGGDISYEDMEQYEDFAAGKWIGEC